MPDNVKTRRTLIDRLEAPFERIVQNMDEEHFDYVCRHCGRAFDWTVLAVSFLVIVMNTLMGDRSHIIIILIAFLSLYSCKIGSTARGIRNLLEQQEHDDDTDDGR